MAWCGTVVAPEVTYRSCSGFALGHGCTACMICVWVSVCVFINRVYMIYLFHSRTKARRANVICYACTRLYINLSHLIFCIWQLHSWPSVGEKLNIELCWDCYIHIVGWTHCCRTTFGHMWIYNSYIRLHWWIMNLLMIFNDYKSESGSLL